MMRIAVIGGGVSGVTVACLLRQPPGRQIENPPEVHLFEQGEAVLRKLRATGNGRCNFTNAHMDPSHYTGKQAVFVEPILKTYDFSKACDFFQDLGISAVTLESGMTYPATLRADTVADAFGRWLRSAGVAIHTATEIQSITAKEGEPGFTLKASKNAWDFSLVVLATGGSYGIEKKEWSNGYSLAKGFGHRITRLHPGIVSLCASERERCSFLQGIRVKSVLTWMGRSPVDDVLFTDYGLSGIGILRLSNDLLDAIGESGQAQEVFVDLLPDYSEAELLKMARATSERFSDWSAVEVLSGCLPRAVAERIGEEVGFPSEKSRKDREIRLSLMIHRAKNWVFHLTGARKKDHGQITCGGIDVDDVDPNRLESLMIPGLYFTGEVLDVQGECGGYNLHWAYASARAVARDILKNRV